MKIVVIDDDPTGSQTVHSCPLLLRWDQAALRRGLRHPSPLLFVLANTRALTPEAAATRNREIVDALVLAMAAEGLQEHDLLLVSRGDSTLRGHGVLEPQVLAQAWEKHFAVVDATLHVPAFFEGGRTTVNGVHLLHGEPVHTTAFARDRLFGYGTSDLAEWLEEKSAGQIAANAVLQIPLALLEAERSADLLACLEALEANRSVVVDATRPEQLRALGVAVRRLQGRKRFLFRSAASLLNGLVDSGPSPLGAQPLDAHGLAGMRRRDARAQPLPGLVVVGSHVSLADQQLKSLLANARCRGIELPVARIARVLEGGSPDLLLPDLEAEWRHQLEQALEEGFTPVLFTSRGELSFGAGDGGGCAAAALWDGAGIPDGPFAGRSRSAAWLSDQQRGHHHGNPAGGGAWPRSCSVGGAAFAGVIAGAPHPCLGSGSSRAGAQRSIAGHHLSRQSR